MNEFNIGDRVRILQDPQMPDGRYITESGLDYKSTIGQVGTIGDIERCSIVGTYKVNLDSGDWWWYKPSMLELVKTPSKSESAKSIFQEILLEEVKRLKGENTAFALMFDNLIKYGTIFTPDTPEAGSEAHKKVLDRLGLGDNMKPTGGANFDEAGVVTFKALDELLAARKKAERNHRTEYEEYLHTQEFADPDPIVETFPEQLEFKFKEEEAVRIIKQNDRFTGEIGTVRKGVTIENTSVYFIDMDSDKFGTCSGKYTIYKEDELETVHILSKEDVKINNFRLGQPVKIIKDPKDATWESFEGLTGIISEFDRDVKTNSVSSIAVHLYDNFRTVWVKPEDIEAL